MPSKRLVRLRELADQHHGEFEVNFSTVTVKFGSTSVAAAYVHAVRAEFGRSVTTIVSPADAGAELVRMSLG